LLGELLQESFRLASPVFGSLLFDPSARLTAGVGHITAFLLDKGHAGSILPFIFGFFDDGRFDELFGWVKVDGSLVSRSLTAGGKRRVPDGSAGP
jgi:hypothetical protein